MLATRQKRDLFGGALRCAGLIAATTMSSSAMAEFVPAEGFNFTSNYAYDQSYNNLVNTFNSTLTASFPTPAAYAGPAGTLNAYASATQIVASAYASISTWLSGSAGVGQYFTVDNAKKALIEWDITNSPNSGGTVYQIGVGTVYGIGNPFVAAGSSGTLSGSYSITFLPGEIYIMSATVFAGQNHGSGGYIRMTWVPAPGAFALLGIGMIGTRRRRRE